MVYTSLDLARSCAPSDGGSLFSLWSIQDQIQSRTHGVQAHEPRRLLRILLETRIDPIGLYTEMEERNKEQWGPGSLGAFDQFI